MSPSPGRIIFANQLRGVCVLCVMLVHYTVVVQAMRGDVAWVVAAPPLDTPVPAIASWANPAWLDLGKFGVGAFFLISGFVVPFSLQSAGAARFMLARALRIYPTFWLALLAQGSAIAASSSYWGITAPYGLRDYAINGLLVGTLLDRQTVDWVSWTLSVEVKFYLAMALLRPLVLRRRAWPLLALAAGGTALNALHGAGWAPLPPHLVSEATYLGFILIGTLFHYHYRGALSSARLALAGAAMLGLFYASYRLGPTRSDVSLHPLSFAFALAAFALAYALRARFRANRALDFLAAISYPLYLVHAASGFAAISFLMMAWRMPYAPAAAISAAAAIGVAWLLHVVVELPTMRLGQRLAARRRPWAAEPRVAGGG